MPPKKQQSALSASSIFANVHNHVDVLNNSKIFAGIMIVILNVASKFVNFKFGSTTEKYLKYTFSRQILVFAMTWMGTRDIYIATMMTLAFIVIFDFLFNEDSSFSILPDHLKEYYQSLDDDQNKIDEKQYAEAIVTIEKYKNQHGTNTGDVQPNKYAFGTTDVK
jgi:hypothetical protein